MENTYKTPPVFSGSFPVLYVMIEIAFPFLIFKKAPLAIDIILLNSLFRKIILLNFTT